MTASQEPRQLSKAETVRAWTDTARNIAQIVALIVAAVWTYDKFIATEAPSLDIRADPPVHSYLAELSGKEHLHG